jgi:hypothetical protein
MDFILPMSKYICSLIWRYSGLLDMAKGENLFKPTYQGNDNRLVEVKGR